MKSASQVWSLESYFPTFRGEEMKTFNDDLNRDLKTMQEQAQDLPGLNSKNLEAWLKLFLGYEKMIARMSHLVSYLECLCSADAANEEYLQESGKQAQISAEFAKLGVELKRSIQSVSPSLFKKFLALPELTHCTHTLHRMREEARKSMTPEKEILAADLMVDGILAWERLYNQLSGKLEFDLDVGGGKMERKPMAQRRSIMESADARLRKSAFVNGNTSWKQVEDVTGAALNHIAGNRLTLYRHRDIPHFLDVALFQAGISHRTLEALFHAVFEEVEVARRIARAKAALLGFKTLEWQDFDAALPLKNAAAISWSDGKAMVENAFARSFPDLATFLRQGLKDRWVESEVRPGKRPGAFCTGSYLTGESRIYMTFNGSLGDVSTLAHEAGHAYHNHVMKEMRHFIQEYPMTLAETASTFAEMILSEGIMNDPKVTEQQKLELLNQNLSGSMAFLLNIPVRFEFEKNFYTERAEGPVPVSRIRELMVNAQRKVYGDTLTEGGEDPWFWASKLHFYIASVSFYNFPYTFGYLLSRGLFGQLKKEGPSFFPKFNDFLRLAGSDTAEQVARRTVQIDLETPDFWRQSIRTLEPEVAAFEKMAAKGKIRG